MSFTPVWLVPEDWGEKKNKTKQVVPSQCLLGKTKLDLLAAVGRTVVCFSLSTTETEKTSVLMQVYRPNLCDVNALKQKAKAWNQQSLTVSAPCTRVINSLLVWRSSAARAVKRPNSHKPFPLTNLLHDLSTRGLQTQNDSPSSPWSG